MAANSQVSDVLFLFVEINILIVTFLFVFVFLIPMFPTSPLSNVITSFIYKKKSFSI